MNDNKKGFISLILVGVLVALVAVGGYFALKNKKNNQSILKEVSDASSIPANWKTYVNNKFNYQIQYPSDWTINFDNNAPSDMSETVLLNSPETMKIYGRAWDIIITTKIGDKNYPESKITTVSGNGHSFDIELSNKSDIGSKIISTFKFIEPTAGATVNWKTYINEKYGFEFKYPNNMTFLDNGPEVFQLGSQPSFVENLQIGLSENGNNYLDMSIYDNKSTKVVSGDYNWNERPCGEMTFSPDDKADSSAKIMLRGYKTLVMTVKSFDEHKYNHFYCINYPANPIVVNYTDFNQIYTDNKMVTQILSTFKFTK